MANGDGSRITAFAGIANGFSATQEYENGLFNGNNDSGFMPGFGLVSQWRRLGWESNSECPRKTVDRARSGVGVQSSVNVYRLPGGVVA